MSENDTAKIARLVADPHADARAEVQGLLVEHERLTLELIATRARVAKLEAATQGMLDEWDKFTRYGSPMAKAANERVAFARAALKDKSQ